MSDITTARGRTKDVASSVVQHLAFDVSGRRLAVSLDDVSEILPYEEVAPMPGLPPSIRGVVHTRGAVAPVIDASLKLGLPQGELGRRACIVMMEIADGHGGRRAFGLAVERVSALLDIDLADVHPVPDFGTDLDTKSLVGIYRSGRDVTPIISPSRLFRRDELDQMQTVGGAP